MSAILVIGELNEGVVASHTFELLAAARSLSDAGGGDVHALVPGDRRSHARPGRAPREGCRLRSDFGPARAGVQLNCN